jgi:hypothetical protein
MTPTRYSVSLRIAAATLLLAGGLLALGCSRPVGSAVSSDSPESVAAALLALPFAAQAAAPVSSNKWVSVAPGGYT